MKNFDYWNKFYGNFYHSLPTQFATFIANEYQGKHTLFDFGCGSGRDTFFFSKYYKNVIGIDSSSEVIDRNNIEKKNTKNLSFMIDDMSNPKKLANSLKENLNENEFNIFYGRFFLHAIDEITENNFLNLFNNLKLKNNLLALEFRITKDEFLKKEFNNHYRRYIDTENFKNKLKGLDLCVKYFIEGQGYAKYKNDDAYVARLIASYNV